MSGKIGEKRENSRSKDYNFVKSKSLIFNIPQRPKKERVGREKRETSHPCETSLLKLIVINMKVHSHLYIESDFLVTYTIKGRTLFPPFTSLIMLLLHCFKQIFLCLDRSSPMVEDNASCKKFFDVRISLFGSN